MIDKAFLQKKIKKIMTSYVQDPTVQISEEELNILIKNFHKKMEQNPNEDIHYLLHDVIYDYLTINYF
ncbi:YqzH family protein [Bacillus sp. FJAT-45350]|uniref:YqzH family protein n=1 Tax=Bacillus sp. FJAT-45350 TaxID=2011014 RepID=UPI000BB89C48|nr:YqzH family protein [Bacillus sp. FJAT-45350]